MSAWKDFVTASLLGTEKGEATTDIPTTLENVLGPIKELSTEARFLTRAGALALWRRAGQKPIRGEMAIHPPASVESLLLINPTGIAHLSAMLDGHCADVLPEWLEEVARLGKRVPPELLPALLEWARSNRAQRPLAISAGGERVRWLAALNPAWNFAADDSPEHWETGGREQRVSILRHWRSTNPAQAQERLTAAWKTESADLRQAFLGVVAERLCEADDAFLETALDDRSKEVRVHAAQLLRRLTRSAFAARMIARAIPLLTFQLGGLLRRPTLEVQLPAEPDAPGKRDGLDPRAFGYHKEFGDRAVVLLQILAATPLTHWTNTFGQSPAALLKALGKQEFAPAVATGWALAAILQKDPTWASAILDGPVQPASAFLAFGGLFAALPEPAQIEKLLAVARDGTIGMDPSRSNTWAALFVQFTSARKELPPELSRAMLACLRRVADETSDGQWPPRLDGLATALALKMPTMLLPEAIAGWPADKPRPARMIPLLDFRHEALAALART